MLLKVNAEIEDDMILFNDLKEISKHVCFRNGSEDNTMGHAPTCGICPGVKLKSTKNVITASFTVTNVLMIL